MTLTQQTSQSEVPTSDLASFEIPKPRNTGISGETESESKVRNEAELLSVSFNQDYSCFSIGTSHGFGIYKSSPFRELLRHDFENGRFKIVEMLFRSNMIALVGSEINSQFPPNKVMIWDNIERKFMGEFSCRSDILEVKLSRNHVVAVLEHEVRVYKFADLKLLQQIKTVSNPRGLCCLSHYSNAAVLACPGSLRGQVRLEHFGLKVTSIIKAHDSSIASLTLTLDGLLLATASTKGTLIRIFNTVDGSCVQEVRRGVDRADIYSIALSPDLKWLVVSSDKGTIHIFSLRVRAVRGNTGGNVALASALSDQNTTSMNPLVSPNTGANRGSTLSFIKGVLPKYFSSEWSLAQFYVDENTKFVAAFGSQNTVIIVGMDGSFYRCSFDPVNGGEMSQQEYIRFIKSKT